MTNNCGKIFYMPSDQFTNNDLQNISNNAIKLSDGAIDLWQKKAYLIACFLSITALEEVGKLLFIILAKNITKAEICRVLTKHPEKQLIAVFGLLNVNDHATRYLGHNMINELMEMVRSKKLFKIRNNCLYCLVNENRIFATKDLVNKRTAKNIICACLEAIAEGGDLAYGGTKKGTKIWQKLLLRSEKFIKSIYKNRPLPLRKKDNNEQRNKFKQFIELLNGRSNL